MGHSLPSDAGPVSFVSSEDSLHIIVRVAELLASTATLQPTRGTRGIPPEGTLLLFETYSWRGVDLQVTLRHYTNGDAASIPEVEFEPRSGEMPEPFRVLLLVNDEPPREGTIDGNIVRFSPIQIEGDFEQLEVVFQYTGDEAQQHQVA